MTDLGELIRVTTGAREVRSGERVQSLWSGYGEIRRFHLSGAAATSVIVKHVEPPTVASHPRGWTTDRSHARKLTSYAVEAAWYRQHASDCNPGCRVPAALHVEEGEQTWTFVLEDLDASGFGARRRHANRREIELCLAWLAAFHARFLGCCAADDSKAGLWPIGTYWHLDTRPDELRAMSDERLRLAAPHFDARLNACRHHTLVHGDAKLANFCFAQDGGSVAAVDFQYVGGGCGIKDVAYFLSSCLSETELEQDADGLLDFYFQVLERELDLGSNDVDCAAVEAEWRELYPFAWADFFRFLDGWAPSHFKIHGYSRRQTEIALAALDGQTERTR